MLRRSRSIAALVAVALLMDGAVRFAAGANHLSLMAVFPVENLTGTTAPVDEVRTFLVQRLLSSGVRVLNDAALEEFMTRHRIRYTAGIDRDTAGLLRKETDVDAVVVASIELASDAAPPKFGLVVRLVSIDGPPTVVWADDAGLTGDGLPGWFDLRLVSDPKALQLKALNAVGNSLAGYVKSGAVRPVKSAAKFRPRTAFRGVAMEPGRQYSVAVVPFVNLSDRRYAGDILSLLFIRHLAAVPQFRVIDRGVVRQQLLDARVVMDGGLSVSDAEKVATQVDADYILGGRVLRYDDVAVSAAGTRVEFSAVLIEKKTSRVVWSSDSYNDGRENTGLFERGSAITAHEMATQMVRQTAEMIAERR